ncbi:MAG: hypothetical protein JWL90_2599 [Chthoniobacteraceae bacterium]|nr:hypothetical protein [Chthoniobacteraceae bacterium]
MGGGIYKRLSRLPLGPKNGRLFALLFSCWQMRSWNFANSGIELRCTGLQSGGMEFPRSLLCLGLLALSHADAAEKPRPLMRDFMGLNGHTVQFKPALYAPVVKLVRDYHPIVWDLGEETSFPTTFPMARNRVDWSQVYGSWLKAGMRVDACLMFDDLAPALWKDPARDAAAYGEAFARAFGPGSTALVESAEIGNEPDKYSDAEYRRIFEAMAGGLRKGDPGMRIACCAANLGPSGRYSKSVDCLSGLESLYDIVNIHLYAEVEGWPTWRRSFPEDPKIEFLKHLHSVLEWRAEHAPGKELWLTEFGWDASSKPAPASGTFAKWEGNTETQQAQWIVRAWMIAAGLGLDRAYLYFFNDEDQPQIHGSSGLTRKLQPKPAYHAVAWLQRSLGDYRFSRVVREEVAESFVYEFTQATEPGKRLIAVWKASGEPALTTVKVASGRVVRAERMPLSEAPAERIEVQVNKDGLIELPADGSPVFVWMEE